MIAPRSAIVATPPGTDAPQVKKTETYFNAFGGVGYRAERHHIWTDLNGTI